jgi:hypothetical protein
MTLPGDGLSNRAYIFVGMGYSTLKFCVPALLVVGIPHPPAKKLFQATTTSVVQKICQVSGLFCSEIYKS